MYTTCVLVFYAQTMHSIYAVSFSNWALELSQTHIILYIVYPQQMLYFILYIYSYSYLF